MPDIQDPWRGLNQATNALFAVANNEQQNRALSQRDRALSSEEERNRIIDEKWQGEKVLIPLKYQQAKMEVGMQFLPGLRRENYGQFHKWATTPIDEKKGLGAIPGELLPAPEQIAALDDEQFEGLKKRMFMSAKQLSEMNVADYKTTLEKSLLQARSAETQKEIEARGNVAAASDDRTMAAIDARRGLEGLQHRNALELEGERFKRESLTAGRGGSDKANIIQTPEGSYTLGEIRGLWKDMNRLPDEFDLQIMKVQNPEQYVKTLKKMEDAEAQFPVFLEKVRRGGLPRPGQQGVQASPAGGQPSREWSQYLPPSAAEPPNPAAAQNVPPVSAAGVNIPAPSAPAPAAAVEPVPARTPPEWMNKNALDIFSGIRDRYQQGLDKRNR